jgi:multicomponent Na+:H+ antiporter subunit F
MMEEGLAVVLALAMAASLFRLARGPSAVDRMMTAQLVGTVGVALVLALAAGGPADQGLSVALVLALLAAIGGITFARRYTPAERERDADD